MAGDASNYDYLFKVYTRVYVQAVSAYYIAQVVLIGDSGVGKSYATALSLHP